MLAPKFTLSVNDKVATMGSCFAQHISRYIERVGLQYFVTEAPHAGMASDEAERRNYGVFSARYGNVYTVRQARQLFDRAFGSFVPLDDHWEHGDRFVDPMRPQVEPDGFATLDELAQSRDAHLEAVRRLFVESDVIVFTLGLTETFQSTRDGAVYPVAPGVHGGAFSPEAHRFVNFRASEVIEDLEKFVDSLRDVNRSVRILLTVSPVPLIATYEHRHVLVSNTISKATLRVAASEVVASRSFVEYFPSYEIIAGSADGAAYFAPDLRQVEQRGVDHVMRVFQRHMIEGGLQADEAWAPPEIPQATSVRRDVVCDEETIEASLRVAGLSSGARSQ